MALTITVLGSSGTYASAGNACSGYLVRDEETTVWLDCGPGTLANVQQHVALGDIDGLVVTHSHPDHWLELPVLRNALRYGLQIEGIPVHGTAETRSMLSKVIRDGYEPTFDWHVISDGSQFSVGSLTFTCSRTDHPVETLAVRIESAGRSIVYSADTGPEWSPTAFAAPIDLAVIEATFLAVDERPDVHVSGRQAGAMAKDAGVKQLVITHVFPGNDPEAHRLEAAEAFGADVGVALPHTTFEVP